MIKKIFLVLLTGVCSTMLSQVGPTQNNLKTWEDTSLPDTVRLKSLKKIANGYLKTNPDSSLFFSALMYNIAKEKELIVWQSGALEIQATASYFKGELRKGIEIVLRNIALFPNEKRTERIATYENNLGGFFYGLGEYEKALNYYKKSAEIYLEVGKLKKVGTPYNNIGLIYRAKGEYVNALSYFNKAYAISKQIRDYELMSSILGNLGILCSEQGNYNRAIEYFTQSILIGDSLKSKVSLKTTYNNIGATYVVMHKYEKGLEYLNKSYEIKKEINDINGVATCLDNIATIYKDLGQYSKALQYYNSSLQLFKEKGSMVGMVNVQGNISFVLIDLADSALYKGDTSFYKKSAKEALKVSSEALAASTKMGSALEIKNSKRAYHKALLANNMEKQAEEQILDILQINNKLLALNFQILTETEKEKYIKLMSDEYEYFNSYSLKRKDRSPAITELVYNNTIKNKGLLLRSASAMQRHILSSNDSSLIKKFNTWVTHKKKLAEALSSGKNTKELEEEINELEKILIQNSRVFENFEKENNLTWKNVKKKLGPDEVAIEFVNFNHKGSRDTIGNVVYCAMLIKANSKFPEMIRLFNEVELLKMLGNKSETNEAYITGIYGKQNALNKGLYNLIWKPLEKNLAGVKKVYYAPSGLLHKISFSALSKNNTTYLCHEYDLELLGSTAKVAMPEKSGFDERSSVSIFGDIHYDTPLTLKDTTAVLSWPYLEGTKIEAEKVAAILRSNKWHVDYTSGDKATEIEFKTKAPQSNIVHIATHGFFFPEPGTYLDKENDDTTRKEIIFSTEHHNAVGVDNFMFNKNPLMRSGLVFAGANEVWVKKENSDKEDGVLTAQEVSNMDLRKTALIILSACETGLGDIKGTEGVYGLQRSLKMAGVKSIIMSLWQVPDAETVEFMDKFYIKLLKQNDVKKSFSESRNEMSKKYDPFYWAAFVLLD